VKEVASVPAATVAVALEAPKAEPEKKESKEAWGAPQANPWGAEIKKASQLASTWDAPATSSVAASNGTEKGAAPNSEETKAVTEAAALPAAAVEAIREEAAHVADEATHAAGQESSEGTFYASEEVLEKPETPAAPAAASAASMDDLVAKVLSKMSPDVLQAVTREILKPVVEAMVKEELKSKKP